LVNIPQPYFVKPFSPRSEGLYPALKTMNEVRSHTMKKEALRLKNLQTFEFDVDIIPVNKEKPREFVTAKLHVTFSLLDIGEWVPKTYFWHVLDYHNHEHEAEDCLYKEQQNALFVPKFGGVVCFENEQCVDDMNGIILRLFGYGADYLNGKATWHEFDENVRKLMTNE